MSSRFPKDYYDPFEPKRSSIYNFLDDFGVVIDKFKVQRRITQKSIFGGSLNAYANPNSFVWQYITIFEIKSGPQDALGWYIYNGPFEEPFPGWNASTDRIYFKNFWDIRDPGYPNTSPIGPQINAMLDATSQTGGVSVNGRVITFDIQPGNINLAFPKAGTRLFKSTTESQVRLDWYNASRYTTYYPQGVSTDGIADQEKIFDDLNNFTFQVRL